MSKITQEFKDWVENQIEDFKTHYIYPKSHNDTIMEIGCPILSCPAQHWGCRYCQDMLDKVAVKKVAVKKDAAYELCPCGLIKSGELEAKEFLKAVRNIIEKGETP